MIIDKAGIAGYALRSGDIFAVKGSGPAAWCCRNLIDPPTDMLHFGLVWMATEDGDRVILESAGEGTVLQTLANIVIHAATGKGEVGHAVAVGRLSMYEGQDLRFFRPVYVSADKRRHAPPALTCYGRNSYGYSYIAKMMWRALCRWASILWHERKLRRLHAFEVPHVMGEKALICTVAANVGYLLLGEVILPLGVEATPNAYEQAVLDGILEELGPGEKQPQQEPIPDRNS